MSAPGPLDCEDVIADVQYRPHGRAEPFAMTITTRAFFILRKKRFAVRNPYFFDRIELGEIRLVRVERLRVVGWYVLAVLLVVASAYTTWGMFTEAYRNNDGRLSVWPLVVLMAGLVLPVAARRRYGLVVLQRDASYRWKPPFVVGAPARRKQNDILSTLVNAARAVGVIVHDERAAP